MVSQYKKNTYEEVSLFNITLTFIQSSHQSPDVRKHIIFHHFLINSYSGIEGPEEA